MLVQVRRRAGVEACAGGARSASRTGSSWAGRTGRLVEVPGRAGSRPGGGLRGRGFASSSPRTPTRAPAPHSPRTAACGSPSSADPSDRSGVTCGHLALSKEGSRGENPPRGTHAIGFAMFAGGMTLLVYGIAQAIQMGNCGTDEYGTARSGPPAPSGFGPMIVLTIAGTFVALGGAALRSSLMGLILAVVAAVCAGVVLGIVDLDEADSRPGLEIVAAVTAPMVLFAVPFTGRAARRERDAPAVPPRVRGAAVTAPAAAASTFTRRRPGQRALTGRRRRDRRPAAPARSAAAVRAARRGRVRGTAQADPRGTVGARIHDHLRAARRPRRGLRRVPPHARGRAGGPSSRVRLGDTADGPGGGLLQSRATSPAS